MKNLKHLVWSALLLVVAVASSCKYDDDEIWDKVNSLDNRLQNVESQLNTMNSDISSMSSVVNALNGYVYVTAVTAKDNGYVISFSDGKTATITNGKDGAAGAPGAAGSDGKDGKDAPVIGFDKDTDGEYYWTQTIDGKQSWLTDAAGNKIPMTGASAVTPRLKVSATGYWMISYDNGVTYAEVLDEAGNPVKAVGKDGQNGFDGDDGDDGDSWFKNVTYDEQNGILTLVMKNGEVIELTVGAPTGIPNDSQANNNTPPTVADGEETFQMPTSGISEMFLSPDNQRIGRFTLHGIKVEDWLQLYGTGESNQNVWVEINGRPKSIRVINNGPEGPRSRAGAVVSRAKADVVFLVDNSGSMSEEANKVAEEILRWAEKLSTAMDVRFGCVGIAEHTYGVNGALNITDVQTLSDYLNVSTGTRRTSHYGQSLSNPPADWEALKAAAADYANGSGECGGCGLHFADKYFKFREGANRYYVLFTDEPNQPGGHSDWSVLTVQNGSEYYNWDSSKGVIYTVFSGGKNHNWTDWLRNEDPCLFSTYTGGQIIETTGSFNISLDDLPVTGAIMYSFIFEFNVTPDLVSGNTYDITITIYYPDGTVKSKCTYTNILFTGAVA